MKSQQINYLLTGAAGVAPEGVAGVPGCAGAVAGACAGAVCAGWGAGFAGADLDDMIDELVPLEER